MGYGSSEKVGDRMDMFCGLEVCWPGSAKIEHSAAIDGATCEKAGDGESTTTEPPCVQTIKSEDVRKPADLSNASNSDDQVLMLSPQLRQFRFDDLKIATRNFRPDSLIGEGGFGYVFKGWVDEHGTAPMKPGTGLTVAVKTLNKSGLQGHKEWLAEINFLGQFHHPNLVKLIGYCIEEDQRLLVYEFMQRGSLEWHLFRRGAFPLPWNVRMKIALGAAKGLCFLHNSRLNGSKPVIYRDFKASNVLLDLQSFRILALPRMAQKGVKPMSRLVSWVHMDMQRRSMF
ncbi:hypothetical protein KP509_23G014100 [Ceratopteris richardii]|uniref:non-specific serine/threonine protein kinase n=1 Tax=Ceratopteris richardii TaxID=49495 RepID=A0A8T2RZR7_CERRI|nr:hypothetical protein KP509_23G014100 [Ceratopteris richardii]